jgi:hypothetical protein
MWDFLLAQESVDCLTCQDLWTGERASCVQGSGFFSPAQIKNGKFLLLVFILGLPPHGYTCGAGLGGPSGRYVKKD